MEKGDRKCGLWFCNGWYYAKDLCLRHEVAQRRYGSPFGIDGRDVIAILERVDDLRDALSKLVEQSDDYAGRCRYCLAYIEDNGHAPGCVIADALILIKVTPQLRESWMKLPPTGEQRKQRERSKRNEEVDQQAARRS